MKIKELVLAITLILCIFLSVVGVGYAMKPDVGSAKTLAQDNNKFAVDLYKNLAGEKGNIFFSPYSISTALAMTYAGARGNTEAEMKKTLKFSFNQAKLHKNFSTLRTAFEAQGKKGSYQLSVANRLWAAKEYKFLPAFLGVVKKNYGAGVELLNFKKNAEGSRLTINKWVEDKTNKKIKDLLARGIITPVTSLVLTNAIYFKGNWDKQYKKDNTSKNPFFLASNQKVKVDMMLQTGNFEYGQMDGVKLLRMPYRGDELSMVVVLPDKIDGLGAVEKTLTGETLVKWTSGMRNQEVHVYFPRFKTTKSFSLKENLEKLGMKDAFTEKADFSGMDGTKGLYISAVIHKAFVEVNEAGTEAAAATAVVISLKCAAPMLKIQEFRADHPFIFMITDNKSGSILFMGRMENPKA
jgi:serpin B